MEAGKLRQGVVVDRSSNSTPGRRKNQRTIPSNKKVPGVRKTQVQPPTKSMKLTIVGKPFTSYTTKEGKMLSLMSMNH